MHIYEVRESACEWGGRAGGLGRGQGPAVLGLAGAFVFTTSTDGYEGDEHAGVCS